MTTLFRSQGEGSAPHLGHLPAQRNRVGLDDSPFTKRDSSGGAESHAAWTDVFVIQSG